MGAIHHVVIEHPPELIAQAGAACLPVMKVHHRMGGETGAKHRSHVFMSPIDHFDQRLPERLLREIRMTHVRPGDDQGIESILLDLLEGLVIGFDMSLGFFSSRQFLEGKRVHEKLCDRIRLSDQAEELPFRRLDGGVRHHVQQPHMQLAYRLTGSSLGSQDILSLGTQTLESG